MMQDIWFKLQRHLRRTNSLQIVLASITVHSVVSIFLIYIHLGWFFDYEINKYEPHGLSSKQGGILFARHRHQINLISNNILRSNELNLGARGWWMDHSKWNVDVECFPQKWLLCTKVLSTQCKPDSVRGIYQNIPIRHNILLQSIEFSLRVSAGDLEEQSDESGYGLYAIVDLSDGSQEILKLEFPHEVDDWTKRSLRYSSPPGSKIVDVTVMLTCIGYYGNVKFAEIEVIPLSVSDTSKASDFLVSDCESVKRSVERSSKYKIERIEIRNPRNINDVKISRSVTLVTQVSMDRLAVLEKTLLTWNSPISLAVYVPVKNTSEGLVEWQRLYTEKKIRNLNLSSLCRVTLVIGDDDETKYPINTLRNIALKEASTKYVLLIDADFQPCPDFQRRFDEAVLRINNTSKFAFVPPAFEYLELPKQGDGIPTTKEELLQLMFREEPIVQPFRVIESSEAHRNTDYWKWYYSSRNYRVHGYSDKYEPYVVVEKSTVPLFDESFTGYGMNKVTHITELYAAKFSFVVLHNAWIIHLPHKSTSVSQEFLQNPILRLRNRSRRYQFIRKLAFKYGDNKKACQAS